MQKENIIEFLQTSVFNSLTYEQKNQIKLNLSLQIKKIAELD